jgi:hypothetical protein
MARVRATFVSQVGDDGWGVFFWVGVGDFFEEFEEF